MNKAWGEVMGKDWRRMLLKNGGLIEGSLSISYLYIVSFTLKRKYNSNTAIHGYRSSVHKHMGMPVLLYLVSGSEFRSLLRIKRALVPSHASCTPFLYRNSVCRWTLAAKNVTNSNRQALIITREICTQRRKGNYAHGKKKKKVQTSYMKTRQRELLLKWVLPVPKTFDFLFTLRL